MMRILLTALFASLALNAPVSAADEMTEKERAREVRSLQKEMAKLEKRYDKLVKRCQGDEYNRPDARACDTAKVTYLDVQQLKKRINTLTKD